MMFKWLLNFKYTSWYLTRLSNSGILYQTKAFWLYHKPRVILDGKNSLFQFQVQFLLWWGRQPGFILANFSLFFFFVLQWSKFYSMIRNKLKLCYLNFFTWLSDEMQKLYYNRQNPGNDADASKLKAKELW